MSFSEPSTLPDWALTAYACGGLAALGELADSGLLPPGQYECPTCRGDREVRWPGGALFGCSTCATAGVLVFFPKGGRRA